MPVVYPWSLIMINNISQKNWIFALGLLTDIQHGNNKTKIQDLTVFRTTQSYKVHMYS